MLGLTVKSKPIHQDRQLLPTLAKATTNSSTRQKKSTSLPSITRTLPSGKTTKSQKKSLKPSVEVTEALTVVKELSVTEQAKALLSAPAEGGTCCGNIRIKFNHYNKEFPIHNGVLDWKFVDEVYSFSFVYRGNYRRDLIAMNVDANEQLTKKALRDDIGDYFLGLSTGINYRVDIEEDPVAGIGAEGLCLRQGPIQSGARKY